MKGNLDLEWPPEDLERVEACPVCGDRSRSVLYDGLIDRVYLSAPGSWTLRRCNGCSSVYLDPRPTADSIPRAYRTYYGDDEIPADESAPRSRLRQLRRSLRNGYLNARYNYALAPSLSLGRFIMPLLPRNREEADTWARHLHRDFDAPTLLDVGCGAGEFLAEMKAAGWKVVGLEPNPVAASLARKRAITVRESALTENSFPDDSFDAVTFRLVLEHLHDPLEALRISLRILRPGGVLWVLTPNLESEGHRRFARDWIFLDPPRHAVLVDPGAFRSALDRIGFELVAQRPSRRARWSFEKSSAIAHGHPPFEGRYRVSGALRLQAHLADLQGRFRTERAEEAIFIARKPVT